MTAIKAFIKRHPVLTYFALTFAISWGGMLLVIGGPGGLPGTQEQFETLLPIAILALLAGPIATGILLTGLIHGRAGFRELLSRLLRWRVGARWCAVALLTAPLLFTAVLLALSLLSSKNAFLPGILVSGNKMSFLVSGIVIGLMAGLIEEIGWTGFAIPTLRRRYSVLATGFIVGLLWAAWHLLPTFWFSGTSSGALSLASFLLDPFLFLVAFRVLMVWVYDRTGSLLVAMLMHVSLTASARILGNMAMAGAPLLAFDVIWAAATWVVVGAVALANRGQFSRQPLRGWVA